MAPESDRIAAGLIFAEAKEGKRVFHQRLAVLQHQSLGSYAFDRDKVHTLMSRS